MKVSIVIPNWNGAEKLKRNLPKVLMAQHIDEVIVVDDASTDDSVKVVRENFPEVKLITKQKNTGFGSNVNLGVKNATGDLVFLLNTDAVPKKDCVALALRHFENPKVFSVGFNTGGNWSWAKFNNGFFWHYTVPTGNQAPKTHETLWVSGGSGLFKKSVWDELGGFDHLYDPFYEEDVDLGYRACKRGYINLWDADAKVEHYKEKGVIEENFPKTKITKVAERNQLIFIWKNISDPQMAKEHILALIKMLIIHPKYWLVFLAAFIRIGEILKKRGLEKRETKLSDQEILGKFSQEQV